MVETMVLAADDEVVRVSLEGVSVEWAWALLVVGVLLTIASIVMASMAAWGAAKKAEEAAPEGLSVESFDPEKWAKLLEAYSKLQPWQAFLIAGLAFTALGAWLLMPDFAVVVTQS